ncbi:NfeD family protein [Kordiimonas gwangyangensis]|uniref:NfeD family protein n=1 Tax=Kordiimonas gwangyangensis TaxID=288022 RepID=UPI000374ED86|nr:hypothetical protein [Kordiimonas gwangyangensis]
MKKFSMLLAAVATLGITASAQAYVGPGAGLSLLGALWALLVAIFAAVGFILAWPMRKWLRKRKAQRAAKEDAVSAASPESHPQQGA